MSETSIRSHRRKVALLLLALVTPLGFACKAFEGPGGWWVRNHGAGLLYEVFWVLAAFALFPTKGASARIPWVVFAATTTLEFLQLSRTPFLEAVRDFALGRVLIGTTFAWWDIPHYAAGCALGWLVLRWIGRRGRSAAQRKNPVT